MTNTLHRQQRLRGKIAIAKLFKTGKAKIAYPLRICYLLNEQSNDQIVVSVPKKLFKRAYKRNLLKRRIREAYRLNQHLISNSEQHKQIAFMYISKEIATYKEIENSVITLLNKINNGPENVN